MKRISYIILTLTLGSVFSCSKQDSSVAPVAGGEIRFSDGAGAELITKADVDDALTESGMSGFAVYGWNTGETKWTSATSLGTSIFNNIQTVKSSDAYVTVGDKRYWGPGYYHFAAYGPYKESSPATFEGYGNSFVLKFTDYQTLTSLDDLIYSDFATDKVNSDGTVDLNFHHALSRILFKFVVNDDGKMKDTGSGISLITIEPLAISLGNFYTKASFAYNGTPASWTGLSEMGNITNSCVVKSEIGYDAYVLPQTLTSDASFSFTYNIVYHSSDTEVAAGPFTANGLKLLEGTGGTWTELQMGMQYSVLVKVNAFSGKIEIAAPVEEVWEAATGTIETK